MRWLAACLIPKTHPSVPRIDVFLDFVHELSYVRRGNTVPRKSDHFRVCSCDKLQLMLKVAVYERWGTGALAEFWDNPDNFPDGGFPAVKELFEALRERRNVGARL